MIHGKRRRRVVAAIALAVLGGLAGSVTLAPAPAASADEVDDEVAQLKDVVAGGDEPQIIARIKSLERRRDKRVDEALLGIVRTSKIDRVAAEAMRVLGARRDGDYLRWARSRLGDKKMVEEQNPRFCAMLDSLPPAGEALRPFLGELATCIDKYVKTRSEVTTRCIAAYAAVCSDKQVVPRLIRLLEDVEGAEGGGGGGGGGGGTRPEADIGRVSGGGSDPRANIQAAKDAIHQALKKITAADGGSVLDWKRWWFNNEKTFRPPTPEPDWANLEEYVDSWFGLTLKKPAVGKSWGWEKCPYTGGRARMRCTVTSELQACFDVITFPKDAHADAEAFAASALEQWKGAEFSEFSEGGQPELKKRRLGGREFAVLSAKGVGSSGWKDWNDCERRLYVTLAAPDTFLVIDAAARQVFNEAERTAFWASIEGMTFKPVK